MKKLYRSEKDSKIFGLCGGLAETFQIDVTILRLVVVVLAFFSGGTVILLYLIASMVIPKESQLNMLPTTYSPFHDTTQQASRPSSAELHKDAHADTPQKTSLDDMMEDIEKKAMQKEIEELKRKISEMEKGDK